jgi:hypothetical protein
MKRLIKAEPEPIPGTSPATAPAELEDWRLRGLTGTIDSNTQGNAGTLAPIGCLRRRAR